ncbi:DNA translocase FtsK [Terrisporobacter hibernicus]|uniref:DUF87 domain-containing protein n=1 Tax=Terrisporobacter hibernicus TaxID=2813371 RepID=A0AAX2ZB60_9FIRM|nr:DNA translocase FtsK [Terrisporobacter hibernicus]UEL46434.1 DUF87 domain-containing protein [Terrisporobacter hibernicus]
MQSYVQVIRGLIEKEINRNDNFTLIKIENMVTPQIYLELCEYFSVKFNECNTRFIGKLSDEKYKYWETNANYISVLEKMKKNDYISKDERLTKWRNLNFSTNNLQDNHTVIFLMGTEAVEDQGGLEDFYTINPEVVESFVKDNYTQLFKLASIKLDEEDSKIINNIYKNIFKIVQKDLLKLSNFIDDLSKNIKFLDLVNEIFENLYSWWSIPNIQGILSKLDIIKENKKIDILEKAYKFALRTSVTKFQTDKKLNKLEDDAENYYNLNRYEIENEFNLRFPGYNSYEDVIEDLKKYIQGIELNLVKDKLLQCDFNTLNDIMNSKVGKTTVNPSTPKIYGDPFRALFLPILIELGSLSEEQRLNIDKFKINVNKIRLANTKTDSAEKDELKTKWKSMCRFLGDIENLINRFNSDVSAEIYSFNIDGDKIYAFDLKNTKELINSGILKSSKPGEQKSKISMEYTLCSEEVGDVIHKFEYEWNILETDLWIYTLNFLYGSFEKLVQQESFLPIGVAHKLNSAFEVKNEAEFIYSIKDLEINYKNILEEYKKLSTTESYIMVEQVGKKFNKLMNKIYTNGLFSTIFNENQQELLAGEFIMAYNKAMPSIINDLSSHKNNDFANTFSKSFMIHNNDQIYSNTIIGAMMPMYHPVMLEKVTTRYSYLANGFAEMYSDICNSSKCINKRLVTNKFDRYDQLSTITSGASMMVGNANKYVDCKSTYGFYSLYGESTENYRSSTVKVDFEVEEDSSEIIQSNPISSYISKTIGDYLNTYPSKIDGITVGFINCNDYKIIITGLHDVISKLEKYNHKCKINLFIYSEDYTCSGKNYIKFWLENKFTEDDRVDVKVYLKYLDVSNITNVNDYLSDNIVDLDLMFVSDILNLKEICPDPINNADIKRTLENRYPSVYLPIPCNEERERKVCISQNQFECEMNFAQLITYVQTSIAKDASYRVVKKVELTNKIEELIEVLHEKSNWVVMLDENIDTQILSLRNNKIIGFTTGNGYFGEMNTAISTNKSHLDDLKNFLKKRLRLKFNNWTVSEINEVAENCISNARYLDGSEILKAINPNDESINNFLAYLLTSNFENIFNDSYNENYYIRKIISLDSHSHLFDNQLDLDKNKNGSLRPDFILVEIPKKSNSYQSNELNINIKIIECKLANENLSHVNKAKDQVIEGYERLNKIWSRDSESVDKRFWFNQLYRILAYNNKITNDDDLKLIVDNLDLINEGNFNIHYENNVYTYWLDTETENLYDEEFCNEDEYHICIKSFGKSSVKKMLVPSLSSEECVSKEGNNAELEKDNKIFDGSKTEINKEHTNNKVEKTNHLEPGENIQLKEPKPGPGQEPEYIGNKNNHNKNGLLINPQIIDLLEKSDKKSTEEEEKSIKIKISELKNRLEVKKIKIMPHDYIIGPDIVRIRVTLGMGVDFNQIEKYAEDMKLWLGINEKPFIFIADGYVNIDIVRSQRQMIRMGDILEKVNRISSEYEEYSDKFYVTLGEDILGNPNVIDMSDSNTPHLLIAGQTGSGKSVLLNSMLASIMSIYTPDQVEMILVDPKQVELTLFEESPYTKNNHIATESSEAVQLLQDLVDEMERRYKLFRQNKVKNIADYNKKNPEIKEKRILMVFDEYGAMIEESKEVRDKLEHAIKQLSQKARAAGIHMIICTQTPRADIITTTIRNNLTARIALRVADSTASSLIIDTKGAESLLGKGDMLVKTAESSALIRTKSPFIDEFEVQDIIDYINC